MSNIKLSFSMLNPLAVFALLRNVVTQMTGNANFANPAVLIADLTTAGDNLEIAITAATNGSKQSRIKRDNALEVVKDLLRKQADYVRSVCDGDREKLGSSGFELRKEKEPIEKVDAPKGEVATSTKSAGEIEVRFRRVRGAHYYKVYHSSVDPASGAVVWSLLLTTTRGRNLLQGFEAYQPNWFRVTAVGVNGESLPSDVAMGRAA